MIHQIQQNLENGKLKSNQIEDFEEIYPEIGDANFKGAL